jgi:hypothetical protein
VRVITTQILTLLDAENAFIDLGRISIVNVLAISENIGKRIRKKTIYREGKGGKKGKEKKKQNLRSFARSRYLLVLASLAANFSCQLEKKGGKEHVNWEMKPRKTQRPRPLIGLGLLSRFFLLLGFVFFVCSLLQKKRRKRK